MATANFDDVLDRVEQLIDKLEHYDEPIRSEIFELLDGIDVLHRLALGRLAAAVDSDSLERARNDPVAGWLLSAYGAATDERAEAEAALDDVRPFIHSHGGDVELVDVVSGVVRVRLVGSCRGCSSSRVTLEHGVEQALRDRWPGFAALEVEPDDAQPHDPPGPNLLQIGLRPPAQPQQA